MHKYKNVSEHWCTLNLAVYIIVGLLLDVLINVILGLFKFHLHYERHSVISYVLE